MWLKIDEHHERLEFQGLKIYFVSSKLLFSSFHSQLRETILRRTVTTLLKVKKNNIGSASWINENLLKLTRRKHRLLRKTRANVRSHDLEDRIAEVSRQVTELKSSLIERDKQSKFGHQVDHKTKWRHLNTWTGISSITGINGVTLSEPKLIAESLNHHFTNVESVPMTNTMNITDSVAYQPQNSFFLSPTTPEEIFTIIKKLKPKKSTGWDGISLDVIKKYALRISHYLSNLP